MQEVDTVSIRILNLKRLTRIFLMSEFFKNLLQGHAETVNLSWQPNPAVQTLRLNFIFPHPISWQLIFSDRMITVFPPRPPNSSLF